ncbi:MAG: hypothetical protein MN733_30450 [Nitrososphaera sp.]|nr:hypothetical protein [Nitrososphaera sp.]
MKIRSMPFQSTESLDARGMFVLLLAVLLFIHVPTVTAKEFLMFIHVSNANAPDFADYGFGNSFIVYEQEFYDANQDRNQPIPDSRLRDVAEKIKRKALPREFVQLDIEAWKGQTILEQYSISRRYEDTILRLKSWLPGRKVGYYGVAPVWAHWDLASHSSKRSEWLTLNAIRNRVAVASDVLYPSLYTYHGDPEKWASIARLVLQQARAMANGKPVIPFLWPRFHPSSDAGGGGAIYLPPAYWRKQLDLVFELADGFVIWNDDSREAWDDDAEWWEATKVFIQEKLPKKVAPAS